MDVKDVTSTTTKITASIGGVVDVVVLILGAVLAVYCCKYYRKFYVMGCFKNTFYRKEKKHLGYFPSEMRIVVICHSKPYFINIFLKIRSTGSDKSLHDIIICLSHV